MTLAARPSPLARVWTARWPIGFEVLLFLALTFAYEALRQVVGVSSPATPLANAADVIDLERALGLFVEPDLQRAVQGWSVSDFITTWAYTLGHTVGFVVAFLWVWFRRRRFFAFFRNWFWAANGLAVVGYWLFPLAPPRLAEIGLADPTAKSLELGGGLSWFQPFRNEFAAMPSMHIGYTTLFALTLIWLQRPSPWRWLALLWPATMLFVTMATANHYWVDGVGGAGAVLLALVVIDRVAGGQPRPWEWRRA